MKTIHLALAMALLVFSQKSFAQWNHLGGNAGSAGTTLWLGTNNNFPFDLRTNQKTRLYFHQDGWIGTADPTPLDIRTNAQPRLFIHQDGRIGVNTITPVGLLHVDGKPVPSIRNFTVRSSVTGTHGFMNSEVTALGHYGVPTIGGNGFAALYVKGGGANGQTTAGYFDGKVVVANGPVGIGTNAPLQTLDVNGRLHVGGGIIQRGGSAITSTGDLGLYSLESGYHMRFVTNNAPFRFFSDGGTSPAGGTEVFTIWANGRAGIGNGWPEDQLQIGQKLNKLVIGSAGGQSFGYGSMYIGFNASRQNGATWMTGNDGANNGASVIFSDVNGNIRFTGLYSTGASDQNITDAAMLGKTSMIIRSDGNVGIGTLLVNNPNNYRLAVNGAIGAKSIKVEINSNTWWPDYVFDETYQLKPLEEVEQYLLANKRLPEIPSAGDIEQNGLDLGAMLKLQMQKIEELTLYVIEIKKENEALRQEIERINAKQ